MLLFDLEKRRNCVLNEDVMWQLCVITENEDYMVIIVKLDLPEY